MSLPGLRDGGRRRFVSVILVCAAAALWGLPSSAGAASAPSLAQVQGQIDQLQGQAEVATERYNATQGMVSLLQWQLTAARARLDEQQQSLQAARSDVGRIAVDTYKAGDFATLSLFLGDDPDRVLLAEGLFVSLGDERVEAVRSLQQQEQLLVGGVTDVQEEQQRLQQAVEDLVTSRRQVQAKLAAATALLGRLTEAQRLQLAQQRHSADLVSLSDLGIRVPTSGQLTCADVPLVIPPGPVGKVLSYACAQVGEPYQWAAAGPGSFDCSGLTMRAWEQAGVSLPHNAAAQAQLGTPVTRDQLQPGDLVFFHRPISHVGIYLGDGLMLHAPQTGEVVRIVPLPSDVVAAARY